MVKRTAAVVLAGIAILAAGAVRGGLYDGGAKDITGGDLNDEDYWNVKYNMLMLDYALAQHQPEGKIGLNLATVGPQIDDLLKKYPKHEDLLKWKTKVADVLKAIDPNAQRGVAFNPGCPWDEANLQQLWVAFHYAKTLLDAKDYEAAHTKLNSYKENYEILSKPDRMKDYPDDLRKFVLDSKADADKMDALDREKLNLK